LIKNAGPKNDHYDVLFLVDFEKQVVQYYLLIKGA